MPQPTYVHPFMTTVYTSSDDYFQRDNAPCHKAQIISDWFLEHDNEFTLLKWPPQSPDLNPIEHLWDVVEREIHIMDSNCVMLSCQYGPKSLRKSFQHLVESMSWRIKTVLKAKGVQPGTSKVYLIKWPVSVYVIGVCALKKLVVFLMVKIYFCANKARLFV